MIRLLSGLVLLVLVAAGAMYYAYGEIDPCRALAVERSHRAVSHVALPIGDTVEHWTKLETSTLTTGQCASDLLDSWGERLSKQFS